MNKKSVFAIAASVAIAGVLTFAGISVHQSSALALKASNHAVDVQNQADAKAAADKASAKAVTDKASADAHDKAIADQAIANQAAADKVIADAKAKADKAASDKKAAAHAKAAAITYPLPPLSDLGSKPCTALYNMGVSRGDMTWYFGLVGYPRSMDVDGNGYPCETVYGSASDYGDPNTY